MERMNAVAGQDPMAVAGGSNHLLLGVNGGDTTEAIITGISGTAVLGRGLGGASNHHRVGLESACQALKEAVDRAVAQIQIRRPAPGGGLSGDGPTWTRDGCGITAACFGLSGVDTPEDEALFSSWLKKLGCRYKFLVCNDSELILGGTPEGWGVALISGTGSICIGRSPEGRTVRVGGWGHLLGDEGSAYFMAAEALKLATQAADGRRGSPVLLQAALDHWMLKDPRKLIGAIYRPETTSEDIAGFATKVMDAATRSDPAARRIVERAAEALALHIDAVMEKLSLKEPPLALAGRMMRMSFKRLILSKVSRPVGPVSFVNDSAQGAIATARRLVMDA